MSRANFNLRGRELSADYEYGHVPLRFAFGAEIKNFQVEDIDDDFEIYDVFDAITGEKIECTKEIRRLVMELYLQGIRDADEQIEQGRIEQLE